MTIRTTYPARRRRLGLSILLVLSCAVGVYCTDTTTTPGQNPSILGLCSFPRACYLVRKSGPLQGQCDSCSMGPACRLSYTPGESGAAGTWTMGATAPGPLDVTVVCGTYVSPSADLVAQCLTPESVCVARGPECPASSYCVAEGQDCATGAMTFPQHRPGSEKSACPTEKSRCCAPSSDGGTGDGGMTDGGSADAGTSDMSSSDAGVRG